MPVDKMDEEPASDGRGAADGDRAAYDKKILVRNRRLRKMEQLIAEGDFFSVTPAHPQRRRCPRALRARSSGGRSRLTPRCVQASSIESRAPSIYHEYVGQYVRDRRPEAGGSAGDCGQSAGAGAGAAGASAEQVPGYLQPGEWREGGCARPLADFLLHSIDKRENRIRREQEAAHYASPSGGGGGGGSEGTGREDAAGERAEEWGEGQEEVGQGGRGPPPSPEQLERLQAEMLRVMCERFLAGGDGEYFDYAAECDDDLELDDLDAMARDAQVLRVHACVHKEVGW